MTTINDIHIGIEEREQQTIDDLDLRHAVFGNGVVMVRNANGEFVLHSLEGDGTTQLVGEFDDPGSAMNALDALEL